MRGARGLALWLKPCFSDYCEVRTCALAQDEVVSGSLEANAWNYYSYEGESEQALVVQMQEGFFAVLARVLFLVNRRRC